MSIDAFRCLVATVLVALLLTSANSTSAQNVTRKLTQTWTGSSWKDSQQSLLTYDDRGNPIEGIGQQLSGSGVWVNSNRSVSRYDNQDNLQEVTQYVNSGAAWEENYHFDYTYFGTVLESYMQQSWKGNKWENSYRISYHYGASGGGLNEELQENWDDGGWVNAKHDVYLYNPEGRLDTVRTQTWVNELWVNTFQTGIAYSINGVGTETRERWQTDAWVPYARYLYDRNPQHQIEELVVQTWTNADWTNSSRTTNTYEDTLRTRVLLELYQSGNWNNATEGEFRYNEENLLAESITRTWDGTMFVNSSRILFLFDGDTETDPATDRQPGLRLAGAYPNPFDGSFTIRIESDRSEAVRVRLFDELGRLIRNEERTVAAGTETLQIDGSALPPGMYLIQVADGRNTATAAVIRAGDR